MTASKALFNAIFLTSAAFFAIPATAGDLGNLSRIVPDGLQTTFEHGQYPSLDGGWTHVGADIAADCGRRVHSWGSGRVVDIIRKRSDDYFDIGFGYSIFIDHGVSARDGKRYVTTYLHLKSPPKNEHGKKIKKGDPITAGQLIGLVGDTGNDEYNCHLHFEVRHFTDRVLSEWDNIYGRGDQTKSDLIKTKWSHPKTLAYLDFGGAVASSNDGSVAFVTTGSANLRSRPSTKNGKIIDKLLPGVLVSAVPVTGNGPTSDWVQLIDREGYMWAGNLTPFSSVSSVMPTSPSPKPDNSVSSAQSSYVKSYRSTTVLPGTVYLPEPSIIVEDEEKCSGKQRKTIKKLAGRKLSCFGRFEYQGSTYLLTQNWKISNANPGVYELVRFSPQPAALGSVAAKDGGYILPIGTQSGSLEILSVAPKAKKKTKGFPYLRYRLAMGKLSLIPMRMFAAGDTPIDHNRKILQEVTLAQKTKQPKKKSGGLLSSIFKPIQPSSRQGSSRSNSRSSYSRNQRSSRNGNQFCRYARWDGAVRNVVDLFKCDETKAIETFAQGKTIIFNPSSISFSGGKYIATMRQYSSARNASVKRMQKDFNWGDWNNTIQNAAWTTITCRFDGPRIKKGQSKQVFAKLQNFHGTRIVFDCS